MLLLLQVWIIDVCSCANHAGSRRFRRRLRGLLLLLGVELVYDVFIGAHLGSVLGRLIIHLVLRLMLLQQGFSERELVMHAEGLSWSGPRE